MDGGIEQNPAYGTAQAHRYRVFAGDGRALLGHKFLDTNPRIRRTPELRFRVLLAGDAEAGEEEYVAGDPYTGTLIVFNVPKLHTV